jgi:hypothetical protein
MKTLMRQVLQMVASFALCAGAWAQSTPPSPVFKVSFPASVRQQSVTGRLFVMISRTNQPEVRLQSHWLNSPMMVAADVERLMPDQEAQIDASTLGYPFRSLADLPPGDYFVQAVLNVYTEFRRADGHVVLTHMDQWEGQQFNKSPGNLISKVEKLRLDATTGYTIRLKLSDVIPPVPVPADTEWIKRIKIQSKLLTQFWGHPIYLGAVVLLPKDYARESTSRYPVIYHQQGHFTHEAPFGFKTEPVTEKEWDRRERESAGFETGYEFYQSWKAEGFPRVIAVSLQHPTPFADMSGLVNSVNNGPYGDAVTTELIPYIEDRFRIVRQPSARRLAGRASGGRDALNLQVRYPEYFGGAWVFQPWAFNFQRYFTLDIYENDNAFIVPSRELPEWARSENEWFPLERYLIQTRTGIPVVTIRQLSLHDAVLATRAGGEFGSDDAMLGPIGNDGYPRPLWNRISGAIDREVADYWREHGDLAYFVEKNWPKIGPHLIDKLHLYAGDRDHFQRDQGVRLFEELLRNTRDPHYAGTFGYAPFKSDYQPMTNAELIKIITRHIVEHAPEGTLSAWQSR